VVDLGFAPGSWSQVAVSKTNPGGRVIGIDVIPSQPPPGANALQGNFLSMEVRERLRDFVSDHDRGRVGSRSSIIQRQVDEDVKLDDDSRINDALTAADSQGYSKEADALVVSQETSIDGGAEHDRQPEYKSDREEGRVVNVVLSDMSAPWPLLTSTWIKSVNIPYVRMMNTSGMAFRDHAGSMVSDDYEPAFIF
jgi:21S rRNA (uridine2791-2'-O)-methyltransferase